MTTLRSFVTGLILVGLVSACGATVSTPSPRPPTAAPPTALPATPTAPTAAPPTAAPPTAAPTAVAETLAAPTETAATATEAAGPTETAAPAETPAVTEGPVPSVDPWQVNAVDYRGANGQRYSYACPGGGEPSTIWGTDVYTDDSSICTAAVHAGVITLAKGGPVVIEIRAGQDSYTGSDRNGITSDDYGQWAGSYVVVHSHRTGTLTPNRNRRHDPASGHSALDCARHVRPVRRFQAPASRS